MSFQQVWDDARHEMARYYLRNSVLELAEAAYLLGYEHANSFARAFRNWEGVPPKHWREANQENVARPVFHVSPKRPERPISTLLM